MSEEKIFRVTMIIEGYKEGTVGGFEEMHKTVNVANGLGRLLHYIISAKMWAEDYRTNDLIKNE